MTGTIREAILDALDRTIFGKPTAGDIAAEIGSPTREVVPVLNQLREEGVLRRGTRSAKDGERPAAIWSLVA
jgi:hypothetical protein